MEQQMQLYWEVYGELFSTDDIIKNDLTRFIDSTTNLLTELL